jgi:hypothetical protein
MREIKFRGQTVNGEWQYGLLSQSFGKRGQPTKGWYISNSVGMPWAYKVRPETIGQFTGLQDKNGKDICEGDILMDQYQDKNYDSDQEDGGTVTVRIYYPVVFQDGCFGWIGENTGEFLNFYDHPIPETEIVGNTYETPELLTPSTGGIKQE